MLEMRGLVDLACTEPGRFVRNFGLQFRLLAVVIVNIASS